MNQTPHNIEAEQSVLGAIMLDNSCIMDISDIIAEEDFYKSAHALIYRSMMQMHRAEIPIETITLNNQMRNDNTLLQAGDTSYLMFLSSVPTSANAVFYARAVKDDSNRRKILSIAQIIISKAGTDQPTQVCDDAMKQLASIQDNTVDTPYIKVKDVVRTVLNDLIDKKPQERGIPYYIKVMDDTLGYIEPADFIIIGGRPGMGKTALALSMLIQQAKRGYRPGMVSMDMTAEKLIRRLLCHEKDADLSSYVKGHGEDPLKAIRGAEVLYDLDICIADIGNPTIADVSRRIKLMVRKEKVDIVYIDYLQQLAKRSDESFVAEASMAIKALAKELNVPIIALAQLNRGVEQRDNKEPRISDLRGSGQLEQDAEIIIFPYRDEVYNDDSPDKGKVKLIFAKTRDSGAINSAKMAKFIAHSMRFTDLAPDYYDR